MEGFIHDSRQHESTVKAKFAEIQEAQQKHHHESSLENFEIVLTQLKSCFERDESTLQRNLTEEILQSHLAIRWRCEELLNVKTPVIYEPPHVRHLVEKKEDILDGIVVSNTDTSLSLAE